MALENTSSATKQSKLCFLILGVFAITCSIQAMDTIMIFRPNTADFRAAVNGLEESLEGEFQFKEVTVSGAESMPLEVFSLLLEEHQPKLIVLMDISAVILYQQYQSEMRLKGVTDFRPALVMMTAHLHYTHKAITNVVGIGYEVPAIVSLVGLRNIVDVPIKKVGVIHRSRMFDYVKRQTMLCRNEGIELIGYWLDEELNSLSGNKRKKMNTKNELKRGLEYLTKERKVDAIWVLNDAWLLTDNRLLTNAWKPFAKKFKKPIIVGTRSLLEKQCFGSFAVIPDHYELGTQAADLVLEIRDNGWKIEKSGDIQDPHSSVKYLNLRFARKYLKLDESKLTEIDETINCR